MRKKVSLVAALTVASLAVIPALVAPTVPSAQAAEHEEPAGEEEPFPAGKREFLRSDHLLIGQLVVKNEGVLRSQYARYDTHGPRFAMPADGQVGAAAASSPVAVAPQAVAEWKPPQVAGRFNDARHDTVVTARRLRFAGQGDRFVIDDASAAAAKTTPLVLQRFPGGSAYAPQGAQPALAAGDLDGAGDTESLARDELVSVTQIANRTLEVAVTDFGLVSTPGTAPLRTAVTLGAGTVGSGNKPSSVAATIGDFDADGENELAVMFDSDKADALYRLALYRYSHGEPTKDNPLGPGKLTLIRKPTAMLQYGTFADLAPMSASYGITSFEAAAADVLGEGRPQLIVSQMIMKGVVPQVIVSAVSFGAEFDIVDAGYESFDAYTPSAGALRDRLSGLATPSDFRPSLAAGMLRFDPQRGFGPDRRGLALAFPSSAGVPQTFLVRADKQSPFGCGQRNDTPKCTILFSQGGAATGTLTNAAFAGVTPFPVMSVAVGGFTGIGAELEPDSVAVAISGSKATKNDPSLGKILDPNQFVGGVALAEVNGNGSNARSYTLQPLVDGPATISAYDPEGESLVLGAPSTITLNSSPIFEAMIEEPPKHLDYLPEEKTFENVSRLPSIALTTSSESATKYKYETSNRSDWGMGGSLAVGVEGEGEVGIPFLAGAKISVEGEIGFGVNYESTRKAVEENAGSHTVESVGSTNDDDLVNGSFLNATVYRYPVLGNPAAEPLADGAQPVFEVVVPGRRRNFVDIGMANGRDMLNLYQPVHENGNALSYPSPSFAFNPDTKTETVAPPADDLGGYLDPTLVAQCEKENADRRTDPVNPKADKDCRTVGGRPGVADLRKKVAILAGTYGMGANDQDITSTQANEKNTKIDRDSTITFKENEDAKFSVSGKLGSEALGESIEAKAWVEAKFDSDQVVGNARALDTSVETSNGMTLKTGNIDPSKTYQAALVYYYDKANRQRVRQYVNFDAPSSGKGWWSQTYAAPDPALNMPFRLELGRNTNTSNQVANVPLFSDSWDHQRIRGFWMVHPSDGPTLPGEPLAYVPIAGDRVGLRVRVYNYSLGSRAENVRVKFEAVPYSSVTAAPGAPIPVGETSVSLDPRQMKEVEIPWDTTSFGPATGTAAQYRMFVTLDPATAESRTGAITETHELLDRYKNPPKRNGRAIVDPKTGKPETLEAGQNNQGFGLVAVAARGAGETPVGNSSLRVGGADKAIALAAGSPQPAAVSTDVHLDKNAIAIAPGASTRFDSSKPYAQLDRHQTVRVTVRSDDVHHAVHFLTLYEGDPGNGGTAIGSEMVPGVSKKGTTVFVDWRPSRTGSRELFAVVHEPDDDTEYGNATAVLKVDVGTSAVRASSGTSGAAVAAVVVVVVGLLGAGIVVMRRRPGSVSQRTAPPSHFAQHGCDRSASAGRSHPCCGLEPLLTRRQRRPPRPASHRSVTVSGSQ